jgi:vacuolar-type H+-ATPase subunit E/Vma4
MKEENLPDAEAAITDKILSDGASEARKAIDSAKRAVASEEQTTAREIETVKADLRAGVEDKIRKARMREVSTARIEAKRILLDAREKAVTKIFGEVEEGLRNLREDPARYRESLISLAAEAASAVGTGEIILKFSERDRGIVDEALVGEINERTKEALKRAVALHIRFEEADYAGCLAASSDGRIIFDNTYRRRLERMRNDLRARIVGELSQSNE